jgi:hypothetical protein
VARRSKFEFKAFDRLRGRSILVSSELTYLMFTGSSPLFSSLELSEDKLAGPIGKSATLKVPSIV